MKTQISTMLIVDDDVLQCRVIAAVASRLGIQASYVSTFDAAVQLLRVEGFDCVTIDLSLDESSGVELLRQIAGLESAPLVIVISGCDERIMSATMRMAADAGIHQTASLMKPIDLVELRHILNSADLIKTREIKKHRQPLVVSSARLERGIREGEIHAAFQPKIDLTRDEVVGCEALARWDCEDMGFVPPDIFIPVAEQSGQIKALTLSILRDAVDACRDFRLKNPDFVMAVNLSASLLSDSSLPNAILAILRDAGLPAKCLMLEVTETTAMTDANHAIDILLQLRLMGVGLSIDDFGTGYSTLATLARMPFNELKIDRSFVSNCLSDKDMWNITRGSIALAHAFGMKVVAEGIEDDRTQEALTAAGCDIGQGYAISRAMRKSDFIKWHDTHHNTIPPGYSSHPTELVGGIVSG